MPAKPTKWTEAALSRCLAARYCSPQYAYFAQVRNAAGFVANRVLDGLAMGLWPSRGLHVTGFEIKTTRSDWLREIRNPAKIEGSGFEFCDFFIVVAPPDVVDLLELPPKWGLLETRGKALRSVRQPELLDAKPFDRHMLAVLLKRLHDDAMTPAAIRAADVAGFKRGRAEGQSLLDRAEQRLQNVKETVEQFEEASGVLLRGYAGPTAIGAAVQAVLKGTQDLEHYERRLRLLHDTVARLTHEIADRLAAIDVTV